MGDNSKKRTAFATGEFGDCSGVPYISNARKHRNVSPLGFRILVKIQKEDNVSEGGLYLPEGSQEKMNESILAEVIEVASASEEGSDEETNISGIPLGATILIPKDAGTRVPWDPNLRIVETKDVLALVEQLSLD